MNRLLSSLSVLALLTAPALYAQAPCALKKDINTGTVSSFPSNLTCCWGNTLYFTADNGKAGTELWKCTASGAVSMVKDIYPGSLSSSPSNLVCCWTGSRALLFFTAFVGGVGGLGRELWVSDGTPAGTVMVKDIRAGSGSSSPSLLTCCNGRVFFRAFDTTTGTELYVSDGTAAGTTLLKNIWAGYLSSLPSNLVSCKGTLYFAANNGFNGFANGDELWKSDGTAAGTVMVKDIWPGVGSSSPRGITCYGNKIVFHAFTLNGREPWQSDGTAAGTKEIADINPGFLMSSSPLGFARCGKLIFFRASKTSPAATATGAEPWVTDCTATGTKLLKDIYPGRIRFGAYSSQPFNFTCCNGKMFFTASNGTPTTGTGTIGTGNELWTSDGTAAGTVLVKDIRPGTLGGFPSNLTCIGKGVYFSAIGPTNGAELWFSDGTAAGTKEVCDLRKGSLSSFPSNLTVCGGKLFFTANDGKTGTELWVIRSPGATKEILGQGSPPSFPTLDADKNPVIGGSLTITAAGGPKGAAGFLGLSPPVALPGPVPLSPLAGNWLDFRFIFIFGPYSSPGFKIPVPVEPPVPPGTKFSFQVWWVNPSGLPIFSVSNGVLHTHR